MPHESSSSSDDRLRIWLERGESGFWLRDAATGAALRWDDPRLRVVRLAGASYRLEPLQDDRFAPGRRLALVPEPENPHDAHAGRRHHFSRSRHARRHTGTTRPTTTLPAPTNTTATTAATTVSTPPENPSPDFQTPGFLFPLRAVMEGAVGPEGRVISPPETTRDHPCVNYDHPFVTALSVESSQAFGEKLAEVLAGR